MRCPVDNSELVMSERQGIEIDYCPQCRGVWLDRGELDKIIDRASPEQAPPQQRYEERRDHDDDRRYKEDRRYKDDHYSGHRPKKKREGFLGDIFDF